MPVRPGLALIAAALLASCAQAAPRAEFLQSYPWSGRGALGGLSGLEVSEDGRGFTALSDRGHLWTGTFTRGAGGRITAVTARRSPALKRSNGINVADGYVDSEGLAIGPDGAIYISFEIRTRIERYAALGAVPKTLEKPPAFRTFGRNTSLEALAIDARGALYTFPEDAGAGRPFPVWRYRGGTWTQPFAIPRLGDWRAVGADFGPDGQLYVLFRDFWGPLGFRSRVARYRVAGDRLGPEELLFESPLGQFDNLEGLSVWRDGRGDIRLTMVSDDNFQFFQRTEFVEYRVAP